MSIQYIRNRYHVPAKQGVKVRIDGLEGVITSARGGYINVRFNGTKYSRPCHPTWRVEYLDAEQT